MSLPKDDSEEITINKKRLNKRCPNIQVITVSWISTCSEEPATSNGNGFRVGVTNKVDLNLRCLPVPTA